MTEGSKNAFFKLCGQSGQCGGEHDVGEGMILNTESYIQAHYSWRELPVSDIEHVRQEFVVASGKKEASSDNSTHTFRILG